MSSILETITPLQFRRRKAPRAREGGKKKKRKKGGIWIGDNEESSWKRGKEEINGLNLAGTTRTLASHRTDSGVFVEATF